MGATKKKSQKERKKSTIGRRTGIEIVASKRIKPQFDGLEDYHAYWTPSENSSSCGTTPEKLLHSSPKFSNVQRISSVIKDLSVNVKNDLNRSRTLNEASNSTDKVNSFINKSSNEFPDEMVSPGNTIAENKTPALKTISKKRKQYVKGRRTGVDMFSGKKIRIDNGVENYEDYWTDSHSAVSTLYPDKTFRFRKSTRIKDSCDADLIPSSSQRKSPLLTTNETEIQTRLNCEPISCTYQIDCITPSNTSESPALEKSVNVSRSQANFVISESSKRNIKNVLHNDNSDINEQLDDTLKSTPSKKRKSLRKDLQKNLSQMESFLMTAVQTKSHSDASNCLDFKTSDGTSVSSTPKRSKNVSNSDAHLVTFESNNKSFMKNVVTSMSDNVSDTADQSDVTYSHDVLSTPSKNKSLRKDLKKNLTEKKSLLLTTNETEIQTKSSSDVTNHLDCIISDGSLESTTPEINKNVSNRDAYSITSESRNKSPVKNVIVSMNDNVSDIEDQSEVIDSHDAIESILSENKSLRKDLKKNLTRRKSLLMSTDKTEKQTKSSSNANNDLDDMTLDAASESSTPIRNKNIPNSDANVATLESNNKSRMKNVATSRCDNDFETADQSDVTDSHNALSTPSRNKKSLKKDLKIKKILTERKSLLMTINQSEMQTKSSSDANNHLDCIISDDALESSTPKISKNISNREAHFVIFESSNKNSVKNIIVSMNDNVSDIEDQSEVIDSHEAIESTLSENKSLRKDLKKNLTQRKSLFMSTDETERQTKSSSNANNNLDNVTLDVTSESSTPIRNKNIPNSNANLVTLECNTKSRMKNVATSRSDNDFENADQSDVTDSNDALSIPSKNKKSLKKDLKIKKNLTERKSLLMTSNDTEMQTKSSSNANNHLNYITSDRTSKSPTLKNVEIPMDDNVPDMQDLSDVIDSHDKLESSSSKNKSLSEYLGTISSKKNKNITENMHSEASNDSYSITDNDPFDSHLHYTLELKSLRKSKTLKENSKAITPKQYDNRSKRHLDLSSSKSIAKCFAESVDSDANQNPSDDNQLTDTNHSLKSASSKKKKINNLKIPGSKSTKNNKQKIFNSAQSICNSDGKTITSEMFLQNSDDQYSSSEQNSNTTERSLNKTSMRSGRNKNTTLQPSRNKNANKSLVNNLSSNSISNKKIKDLKSLQNKTVTSGTTSKMPESQSKKKTKTSLSKKNSENLIIQSVEPCVRRSTRIRLAPFEHWRNERRQFNRIKEEAIWEKGDEDFITERFKKKIGKNIKKNKAAKIRKLSDNTINLKHIKNTLDTVAVINPNTGDEEDVYVFRPFNTLLWSSPQSQDSNHPSYQVTKCIAGEPISFGYIDINFKKKKEKQYSPTYNITFSVIKGKVKVTINKSKIMLEPLDVITVPCCNTYSIDNIGSTNALLFFCTYTAPIFKYQVSRS